MPAGLKDPRVGFVTVTDVKTSPDLRHARVFVSVLGDEARASAQPRRAGLRPRLPAGAGRARAASQAHARRSTSNYDDTADRARASRR